jgi:hypothetical protein
MKKRLSRVLLFACIAATAAWPDAGVTAASRLDWKAGWLEITVTRPLDPGIPALPRAKAEAEAAIDAAFLGLFTQALSGVAADSRHSYAELASDDPSIYQWLQSLARDRDKDELSLTQDFSALTARYRVPLFGEQGLGTPLVPEKDSPVRRSPGYVASRVYTGVLIYAADPLPAVGSGRTQKAVPVLFPRLFDQEMNLLLDRSMCRAADVIPRGMVSYADSIDEDQILRTLGRYPLRTAARAVFGATPADLVIPTEAARQLAARPENIELLKTGRIMVIYGSLE